MDIILKQDVANLGYKNDIVSFLAGAVTGPKTLPETLGEAASAALAIDQFLKTPVKR